MTVIRKPDATSDSMYAYLRSSQQDRTSQSNSSVNRTNRLRGRIPGGVFEGRQPSLTAQRVTFGRSPLMSAIFERDTIKRSPPATDCEFGPPRSEEISAVWIAPGMMDMRNTHDSRSKHGEQPGLSDTGVKHIKPQLPLSTEPLAFGVVSPWFELHLGPEAQAEMMMYEMREKEKNAVG